MFLNKKEVIAKLEAAKEKRIPQVMAQIEEIEKRLKDETEKSFNLWHEKRLKVLQAKLKGFKCLDGIPFRVRSGQFYTGKCGFNPETGDAHSYDWYILGREIDGVYILNTFGYSMQTSMHVNMLRNTLRILGVEFSELEAPKGLQSLESSRDLYISRIAQSKVAKKYGNKKNQYRDRYANHCYNKLDFLDSLGVSYSEKMISAAMDQEESSRLARLERDAAKRDEKRVREYKEAARVGDLVTMIKFIKYNKKRAAKGLPELKTA